MRYSLFVVLCLTFYCALAQEQDFNWVFGHHAGLNFSSGSPVPFTSTIYSVEDCASISDSSGELMFYTNGVNVYDRTGVMMPNGDSLATNFPWQYGADAPQSVLILPVPGSSEFYFLFTRSDSALFYSVIDMNLNGGYGDLAVKNQMLYDNPVQRYMTAIKHSNGEDWWLIAHGLADNFLAFRVTSTGIDSPAISHTGIMYYYAGFNSHVEITANLQGTQLAFSSAYGIHLVDFDRCLGTFSNFQTISLTETPYSFAYSPDGSKLYFSFHYNYFPTYLKQLCLDCGGPLDSNITEIYYRADINFNLAQIQNGPDKKIYVAMSYWWPPDTINSIYNRKLSVINNPNALGMDCNFDTATISLSDNFSFIGLPNSPNYSLPPLTAECDSLATGISSSDSEDGFIFPNPVNDVLSVNLKELIPLSGFIIADESGRTVLSGKQNFITDRKINVSSLFPGIYCIRISSNGKQIFNRSFVKE